MKHCATFTAVFFQVRTRCNGRCAFCLASVETDDREDLEMSYELYNDVLKQLQSIRYYGRIAYHVNNEPLLFKELDRFVARATELLPRCRTQVLTNGLLLTEDWATRLINAGLKELTVNYYAHKRTDLIPRFKNVGKLIGKRIPTYRVFIRNEQEVLNSRGGTAPNKTCGGEPNGYCEYPFTQFNIDPTGLVSKCCADVRFSDVMGDLTKESVVEIWNGEKLWHVRDCLLQGDRQSLPNCRYCDFSGDRTQSKTT